VTYYQVVFTLPSELSELALANRESLADVLFESAAKSLRKTIRTEQGYDPASMMVLHTWNQQLHPHWHVHALVPGGGPSLTNKQWKSAQSPADTSNSDGDYLVDAIRLRETFRKYAMARLRRLYKAGKLNLGGKFASLQDEGAWSEFCEELSGKDWVSYIQPPPGADCSAAEVVRYLARYLTGGPISDSRILAADSNQVTFLAREGKRVGGERLQVPVTLPTLEFVRRWCEHIQPDQLTKTRYFGGWCGRKRKAYQADCRRLLGLPEKGDEAVTVREPSPTIDSPSAEMSATSWKRACPCCGNHSLQLIATVDKPSWSEVLTHLDDRCPEWYAESEHREFCEYLDRVYGISYEDWYLEMRIESPMSDLGGLVVVPVARQMYLPGLTPQLEFHIESF
jgi:hypothetical protein